MSEDDEEGRAIVLPTWAGESTPKIVRSSWRVPCEDCGQPCFMSTGTARYAPGYKPQCIPCFERAIGRNRARFILREVFRQYFNAHEQGRCVPGVCPILGCSRGPAEIN